MFATLWDALLTNAIWAGHMTSSTENLIVLDLLDKATSAADHLQDYLQSYRWHLVAGKLDLSEVRGFALGLVATNQISADDYSEIDRQISKASRVEEDRVRIAGGTVIERPEDMSPDGRLSVCMDHEGDVLIRVIPPAEKADSYAPSVEFVSHCPRSRHTLAALRELMRAMARDNEENPLPGQQSQHPVHA
ncbi:hypothetical protein EFK68_02685 [Pseudomonas aeruginosa]|nr:hypothetical protein EFK68_02685 [Pseudomonas aeruginosa]